MQFTTQTITTLIGLSSYTPSNDFFLGWGSWSADVSSATSLSALSIWNDNKSFETKVSQHCI